MLHFSYHMQPTAHTPYVVIADDLTGANDAGIQFAAPVSGPHVGLAPYVHPGGRRCGDRQHRLPGLTPAAAYSVVYALADRAQRLNAQIIYAKVDSTLRGNIGPMLDAILDACGLELAVLCPAFPANARTMLEGVLLVDGLPVAQTAFGNDATAPVRKSHVPTLLAQQTRRPVNFLPFAAVSAGVADSLASAWPSRQAPSAALPSATPRRTPTWTASPQPRTPAVNAAAGRVRRPGPRLAGQLAAPQTPCNRTPTRQSWWSAAPCTRPRAQLQTLTVNGEPPDRTRRCRCAHGRGSLGQMAQNHPRPSCRGSPGGPTPGVDHAFAATVEATNGAQATAVTERLAQALASSPEIAPSTPIAGLVATGGDTARAVLTQLGVAGVDLLAELAPGIPIGLAHGGPCTGMPVITKAGGFGRPDALIQAVQWLVLYRTYAASRTPAEVDYG